MCTRSINNIPYIKYVNMFEYTFFGVVSLNRNVMVFGVDELVSVLYSREEWPSKGDSQIFVATTAVMFGFTYQE